MDTEWIFLINPILVATNNSNILGIRITNWHDGALYNNRADAFILALYTPYHIISVHYVGKFADWKAKVGIQISKTKTFNDLLVELGFAQINAWDAAAQAFHPKGSDRYLALFPHGHDPFQRGTQEERKAAVMALSVAIGSEAALSTLKIAVDGFYTVLNDADIAQKGAFTDVTDASTSLEDARVAMCIAQYANLGALMQYYAATPNSVAVYFDLKSIRKGRQMLFTGLVKKNYFHKIVERTLLPDTPLMLTNNGVTDLKFYISDKKNGTIGATFIIVAAGNSKEIVASDLGDVTTLHFLMVFNPDLVNKGEFEVEFL
jgi:hypothetical protein